MNTYAEKKQETKSKAVANRLSKKSNSRMSPGYLIDNRPEATAQRKLQELANNSAHALQAAQLQVIQENDSTSQPIQKNEKKTGIPDNLESGMENLSGMSMEDVKVHYNSAKPAQLNALAYAQGQDIHLGPGQERHLPHEGEHAVPQMQGRVKPTMQTQGESINDTEGLEKEADVMGQPASSWETQPKENSMLNSDVKVGSKVVQKRDRGAVVVWNVTHEVIPDEKSSLFGDDSDSFKNEGRELYRGEKIVVDDEDIFQSRRGANQEISERRKSDQEGHLTNKWLKLKDVNGSETSGKGYVREETIRIIDEGVSEKREIHSKQMDIGTAKGAADTIHKAWEGLRGKRRMSVGAWEKWESKRKEKGKESSPSWDQIEEGYDVSKQLSNFAPKEYENYKVEEEADQAIITAYDQESENPMGIIVIEKRTGTKFPLYNNDNDKKWYLRWLIGHPTLKGAGGLLLGKALDYVKDLNGTAVWVESAPSAVEWYQRKGFKRLEQDDQKEYDSGFEEGWDSTLMVLNL